MASSAYTSDWSIAAYKALGQARFDAQEWREYIYEHYLAHEDE